MTRTTLKIYRLRQPLSTPYRLSFATLTAFDTLILSLTGEDSQGFGEITPLPGYSDETIDSALQALERARVAADRGRTLADIANELTPTDPMVASALVCAEETRAEGVATAFKSAVSRALPLAALCGGVDADTAAAEARRLEAAGYAHLKLKAGGGQITDDIVRLRAVAAAVGSGVDFSVDANQRLTFDDARALCDAAARLPVLLVEQPFVPDAWDTFASLAAETPVPLMLDESIWTAADIEQAREVGAAWVKLKLCKHPGMAANRELISHAKALGLRIIYGNGVQGAIGNHLESRVYSDAQLDTPGEFNGVLKLAEDPFAGRFAVADGALHAGGLRLIELAADERNSAGEALGDIVFTA